MKKRDKYTFRVDVRCPRQKKRRRRTKKYIQHRKGGTCDMKTLTDTLQKVGLSRAMQTKRKARLLWRTMTGTHDDFSGVQSATLIGCKQKYGWVTKQRVFTFRYKNNWGGILIDGSHPSVEPMYAANDMNDLKWYSKEAWVCANGNAVNLDPQDVHWDGMCKQGYTFRGVKPKKIATHAGVSNRSPEAPHQLKTHSHELFDFLKDGIDERIDAYRRKDGGFPHVNELVFRLNLERVPTTQSPILGILVRPSHLQKWNDKGLPKGFQALKRDGVPIIPLTENIQIALGFREEKMLDAVPAASDVPAAPAAAPAAAHAAAAAYASPASPDAPFAPAVPPGAAHLAPATATTSASVRSSNRRSSKRKRIARVALAAGVVATTLAMLSKNRHIYSGPYHSVKKHLAPGAVSETKTSST